MNAKQHLESLRLLDARIEQRIRQLDELKKRRSFAAAAANSEADLKTSRGCGGASEYGGNMIAELQSEISEKILQFEQQRNEIINKIQDLNDFKFVRVLYKRYVEYKPFEQIASELGYARSHTLLLHRNAIAALESAFE